MLYNSNTIEMSYNTRIMELKTNDYIMEHLYITIDDVDYNMVLKFLQWKFGSNKVKKVLNETYDKKAQHTSFYKYIHPAEFFKSINIAGINIIANFKDIDHSLISIFDYENFEKLLNYWEQSAEAPIHKNILNHLKQNYKQYIDYTIIKSIIE